MSERPAARLMRLEIQGFKSFASKTVFPLDSGVIAVVGPNGSGKSNIADALRWVLGEQNPRVLRLRRIEDVIFAGGGKRGPAGFAEVNIVLDNQEGWLPLAFAEVSVSRRLYRSGESEYLINKRKVRLREVVDLFLTAQLGQNSYAILGQGMVDLVLSLKPEERRGLIEEAADVRRHRVRIDEATAQLTTTRTNRDNVELLLAEIAPRLSSLGRQAKRAAEYNLLATELAERLRTRAHVLLRRSNLELVETANRYEQAVAHTSLTAVQLQDAESGLTAARAAQKRAEVSLQGHSEEGRQLRDEIRILQGQASDQDANLTRLIERQSEAARDLQALEDERHMLSEEGAAAPDQIQQLSEARRALADAQARLSELDRSVDEAKRNVRLAEAAVQQSDDAAALAAQRLARMEQEQRQLEQEAVRYVQRRSAAKPRLAAWARDFRTMTQASRLAAPRLRAEEQELQDATRRATATSVAAEEKDRELARIQGRVDSLQQRLELLERQEAVRRPAGESLLALLDALRGGGPGRPRVLGVLGGIIKVQRGMEVAIEAALSSHLDAALVRDLSEGLGAIETLQGIEGGRIELFALDEVRSGRPLQIHSENGILGVASQFVRCDGPYQALVDSLLGRVVVVEQLDAALAVVRRGLGVAVMLDGTVIGAGGLVSGGRGKGDGAGFSIPAELEELRAELQTLDPERGRLLAEAQAARAQARSASERARRLRESVDLLAAELGQSAPAIAKLGRRLEPLRGELEWLRRAIVELEPRRADAVKATESLRADVAQLRTTADQQRGRMLPVPQQALSRLLSTRAAAIDSAREAHTLVAGLERAQAAAAALSESRRAARERTDRLINARSEALLSFERERAVREEQRKVTEQHRRTAEQALKEWQPAHAVLEATTNAETAALRTAEAALDSARRAALKAEAQRLEAESNLQRAHAARKLLLEELALELDEEELQSLLSACQDEGTVAAEAGAEERIRELRTKIRSLGAVNAEAKVDYEETKERHRFLTEQVADLKQAEAALMEAIDEVRGIARERFRSRFEQVSAAFSRYFETFFGGGQARLVLQDEAGTGESGVEVIAQPPGKRLQNLAMLSGGERSMTAVALLFALLECNPAPFCVLDEVDAALDEANVGRFGLALAQLAATSQFLVITHNRGTVQAAGQIYGISMAADGASSVLSLRLDDAAPALR